MVWNPWKRSKFLDGAAPVLGCVLVLLPIHTPFLFLSVVVVKMGTIFSNRAANQSGNLLCFVVLCKGKDVGKGTLPVRGK